MVLIGISILGVQGLTVRHKAPLLESPLRDQSMLEASCLVNIALFGRKIASELETATRRSRHHAHLSGPYHLVAWFRCAHRLPLPRSQRAGFSEKGAHLCAFKAKVDSGSTHYHCQTLSGFAGTSGFQVLHRLRSTLGCRCPER